MKKKNIIKRNFNLGIEYKISWKYLKDSKKFIYSAIGIFLLFALIGFFVPSPDFITEKIVEFINEILRETEGMSAFELIRFIIFNNIKSTFFGILLGILFGVFPIVSAIANGYLLGFVSLMSVNSGGILTLWKIFPHGIFELPAIFISLGLGIKLGTFIFQRNKKKSFNDYLLNSLRIFLLVIIPLLIIAGIIEGSLIWLFS